MFRFENLNCLDTALNTGAFLCSGDKDSDNLMVIAWGMVGVMWKKKVFAVPVRESRYTKEFIERTNSFTVCIPKNGEMKEQIKFCGTKSGREYDKWNECGLEKLPAKSVDGFVVGGCDRYFECKVVGKFEMTNMDVTPVAHYYTDDDRHTLYIGEIIEEY